MINTIILFTKKLFSFTEWRIGLVPVTQLSNIIETQTCDESWVNWLNIDNQHYQADPFLCHINESLVLMYESMSHWQEKGKIKYADVTSNPIPLGEVKAPQFNHKSFPYTFSSNGKLYCMPEESDMRELNLFEYSPNNEKFEFRRTLFSDMSLVDSFMYHSNGIFYLFCTDKSNGSFVQRLFVSHSLDDRFEEHPNSPIASGKSKGRNAGGLIHCGDKTFRLSQECRNFYGEGINFNLVKNLDHENYSEEFSFRLKFVNSTKFGYHTFNVYKEWIVIDGKVLRYSLLAPLMKFNARIIKKLAFKLTQ